MTTNPDRQLPLGSPSLSREAGGEAWPPSEGKVANHLGWLAREPWPSSFRVTSEVLGKAIAQAARLHLSITQPEGAPSKIRDAAASIADGMHRLGLQVSSADKGISDTEPDVCFVVCSPQALPRLNPALLEAKSSRLVVTGAASEEDLSQAVPYLRRFPIAATDPALVSLSQAAGARTLLWGPVQGTSRTETSVDNPLISGLPRTARTPSPVTDVWQERPLDVLCIGPEEPARTRLLGSRADELSRRTCVLVHRRGLWRLPDEPILPEATARYLFDRAKITLNIQSGDASALDWSLGVLDAMALGSVVISTPCFPHPFLRKDVHYLEATPDRMLLLVDWLLDTAAGRRIAESVRGEAVTALAAEAKPIRQAALLLNHALDPSQQMPT